MAERKNSTLTGHREDVQEKEKKIRLMLRNSQQLLGLTVQLLELSKFNGENRPLPIERQNIVPFLKDIFHSFDLLAMQNELELTFHAVQEEISLYFEPGKLEEMVCNLLLSAFKYTAAGGRITLTVTPREPQDRLDISIGGTGTEFIIRLPMGDGHSKPVETVGTDIRENGTFMKELRQMIDQNISNLDFNVEQLARKLYMSQSALYRKVLSLTGEPPVEFLRSYRLQRAAQLLQNRSCSVTDAAYEVGFNSRTYFSKCFKDKFHRRPSEFK